MLIHDSVHNLIYGFGSSLCHQLPQRSLLLQYQSFVCARDIGIYFGVFLGALLILATKKKSPEASLPMAIFFLPLAIDGLTEYASLQPSSNIARIWTGLFFGIGLAFLVATLFKTSEAKTPLQPKIYILSFALSVILLPIFFTTSHSVFMFLNTVSFITLIGLIATLSYLVISTINDTIKNTGV